MFLTRFGVSFSKSMFKIISLNENNNEIKKNREKKNHNNTRPTLFGNEIEKKMKSK